ATKGDGDDTSDEVKVVRRGISTEGARKVIDADGRLSHFQAVRCRMRWFTEGVAFGSAGFLRRVLEDGVDVDDLKPLPLSLPGEGGSEPWFSLSRMRRMGVG
ncbi:MAG: hypothetical protein KAG66_06860, partial [Methylococcales bacterium]|nr:hypothetical protein [Methylococcales bacterium]